MEFLLGGAAACGAGLFTNPLEVAKTRLQLQGELKARGKYSVHYRHVFHAFFAIGKHEGILALQKGLVPALWYQFFMNGLRLGAYQCFVNWGMTKDSSGASSVPHCVVAGALSGCTGAVLGSPVYMVKTQLQSMSAQKIAVGFQHKHVGMTGALLDIHRQHGLKGLWRGVSGAVPRVMIGSAAQLSTFTSAKEYIVSTKVFTEDSWLNALSASMLTGCVVVAVMTPFDVVSTRLYNQGTDATGRGLYYNNVFDCFSKIFRTEGLWGFYKGWGASYFRLGPHTILSLVFWDEFRKLYLRFSNPV